MSEMENPTVNNRSSFGNDATLLLNQISKNIRTPMNVVIGSTEQLLSECLDQNVRDSAETIRTAAEKLRSLTDDVIEIIRINNGIFDISDEEYCFSDLSLELRQYLEVKTSEKKLEAKMEVDDTIPYRMFGDRNHIVRLFSRLIDNAVDSTGRGMITLVIKAIPSRGGKVFLRFDLTDTGDGYISEDVINVLNGHPIKHDISTSNIDDSTIVVFLAKYITTAMHGKITAKSRKGVGCTFTVLLEQRAIGNGTIKDYAEPESRSVRTLPFTAEGSRVLVVDDSENNVHAVHSILRDYLVNVDMCYNGEEAIELVRRIRYDVVFVDRHMKGMNGFETATAIREIADDVVDEETAGYIRHLPIIGFTSDTSPEVVAKLTDSGMNDYIAKPIGTADLERAMRKWIPGEIIENTVSFEESGRRLEALEELGLNTGAALANFEGNEDEYRDVLLTLCRSSDTKAKMLRYYMEHRDYKNYVVAMHGIIGVAQVIGAETLAEEAKELEKAAKQGLRDIIEKKTDSFGAELERMLSSIRSIITSKEKVDHKGLIEREDLISIIGSLHKSLEEYKIDEVEDLFFTLAQFAYPNEEITELVHKAEECMLSYDYNSVIDVLDRIMEIIG